MRRDRSRVVGHWDQQAPASDLVITRTGAVAWIRVVAVGVRHVVIADATGERVLEAGGAIEPGSLAVAARHVYWTSGGEPRSAVLD